MCKLAIIIPYYKLSFFEETLKSLTAQTDQRFKVYIGNDASLENPEALINRYSSQINLVYQKFDKNFGGTSLVKQWDRCISLIEDEEWIMILGDDDYLSKTVVKSFYDNYDHFKADANVVRFASQMVFDADNSKSKIYTHPVWEAPIEAHMRKYDGESRSSLSEHIFTKAAYKKHGFVNYALAWYSDDKAWIDFSDSKPMYTINNSFVYIRVSNESISGQKNNIPLKQDSAIRFYKDIIKQHSNSYSKPIKLRLLYIYEVIIKRKRKLKQEEWQDLSTQYRKHFNNIAYFKFLRRKFLLSK